VTDNPYAPPAVPLAPPAVARGALASRTQRFAGIALDALFEVAVQMSLASALRAAGIDPFPLPQAVGRTAAHMSSPMLNMFCYLVPAAVQWTLIARSGQSLGKKALRTVIVTTDGRTAGFVRGALLRAGPWIALAFVSASLRYFSLGKAYDGAIQFGISALTFLDGMFIFGPDVRCIHDYIAGTNVVRLERKGAARTTSPS
jgi:uncharacterized RDD family membrane protein YckC